MANKSSRFQEGSASDTPGPGSYSLSKKSDWIKMERKTNSAPTDSKAKSGLVS